MSMDHRYEAHYIHGCSFVNLDNQNPLAAVQTLTMQL